MAEISETMEIINKLGLHARAAAALVRVTSQFKCTIQIVKDGVATDGKSILGMMSLAAGKGTHLTIRCDGEDQEAALSAIRDCIGNRFGESE